MEKYRFFKFNRKHIIYIIFIFFPFISSKGQDEIEHIYQKGSKIYHQIKNKEIASNHTNWDKAADYFLQIIKMNNKSHPRLIDSYYSLGICRINTENYLKGIINFRNLIKTDSKHRLADDAQYLTGYCFLKRSQEEQALLEFERVIYHYPNGDMISKALNEVEKLYKKKPNRKRQIKIFEFLINKAKNENQLYQYKNKLKELNRDDSKAATIEKELPIRPKYEEGKPKFLSFRFSSSSESSRLVIEFDQIPKIKHNYLENNNTIYIDFINSIINRESISEEINNGIIKSIKLGQYDKNTVRVSIYLEKKSNYHVFKLDNPARIVLDAGIEKQIKKTAVEDISIISQLGLKVSTVIIDPGHGGRDPGTCYGKYKEKDIVLSIAKTLYEKLNNDPEFQPILTRDKDQYLYLEERTEIANSSNGDLFISLHVNSHKNKSAHGIETYYLSLTDDQWSKQLAAKENATTNLKINDLNDLLSNLLINSKLDESIHFAHVIHKQLLNYTKSENRGIKKAPFVVLIGSDMPSILVEIGFITNKNERINILSKYYQEKIAEALYQGIKNYSLPITAEK